MDLKNAAAVCLIALFSATLVVLIARSLDNQAAARLEPQLANIAEELRALRTQGGIPNRSVLPVDIETVNDGLVVYYFHSKIRCPTCQAIESQTKETVHNDFAKQLGSGEVIWKVVNYEDAAAKPLATKFEIQMPVVVLAKMKDGEIKDWKRLDQVWGLVGDKPAFTKYVRAEIDRMLPPSKTYAAEAQVTGKNIPTPNAERVPAKTPPAIPIP